jgi:phytanoyl-CoA hydroxylase
MLSEQQISQFIRDGYLVIPQLTDAVNLQELNDLTSRQLEQRIEPFELEADVHYPGAPASTEAEGGKTIRRLLHAYQRHEAYKNVAENDAITSAVKQLLQSKKLFITPNHHNCVMTKQPEFSSKTNWHRDTRYWHFSNKYLINAWLALGDEKAENGGMLVLPGSHRWDVDVNVLDEAQFLLEDHPSNQARLSMAKQVDLQAGDCLLFSAHCFHAAGANQTDKQKFSLVFTYHGQKTHSIVDTKSSLLPSIEIST